MHDRLAMGIVERDAAVRLLRKMLACETFHLRGGITVSAWRFGVDVTPTGFDREGLVFSSP
jgi:hypothetical protein